MKTVRSLAVPGTTDPKKQCHVSEDTNSHQHRCDKCKSHHKFLSAVLTIILCIVSSLVLHTKIYSNHTSEKIICVLIYRLLDTIIRRSNIISQRTYLIYCLIPHTVRYILCYGQRMINIHTKSGHKISTS